MKKVVGFALGMLLAMGLAAQPGWNYEGLTPADQEKAQEYMVTMGDDVKADKYEAALPKVEWLLAKCPKIHKSLYINGVKVYEGLVKDGDPKTDEYEDKAMKMYDMRIEYFGDEANVLNRKGQKAWVYWKDRPEKTQELFDLYKKIFELNGKDTYAPNTVAYMDMACKMKGEKKLNDEQVLEAYDQIINVLDANAEEKYERMREPVENMLAGCVQVDCEFVRTNMVPKFKAAPELKLAKKMFSLMSSGGCTNDPIFFDLMEYIDEREPSCGMKITMARKAKQEDQLDKALKYYQMSLDACGPEKAAEIYYDMAVIYSRKGDKVSARSYAQKSIAAGDANKADAYNLIGDLYFASFQSCVNSSLVKSRAVYIAAYDKYKMAGNSSMMSKAMEQFPSIEEIFTENMKEGQSVQVECWINETVTLMKR